MVPLVFGQGWMRVPASEGVAVGEKGNTEVIEQLKQMAQQQEPGLRDRVMQMLSDYQTISGISGGGGDDEGSEGPGQLPPPPPA
jgi:hypothetical protein